MLDKVPRLAVWPKCVRQVRHRAARTAWEHLGKDHVIGRIDRAIAVEVSGTASRPGAAPVVVSGMESGVTAVAGGDFFSLAVKNSGRYACGDNKSGQLGDGTTDLRHNARARSR